jgi:hypothetical protein
MSGWCGISLGFPGNLCAGLCFPDKVRVLFRDVPLSRVNTHVGYVLARTTWNAGAINQRDEEAAACIQARMDQWEKLGKLHGLKRLAMGYSRSRLRFLS